MDFRMADREGDDQQETRLVEEETKPITQEVKPASDESTILPDEAKSETDTKDAASRGFRAVRGFGAMLQMVLNWEFGTTPKKNSFKRFLAAFLGAFIGSLPLLSAWIYLMGLGEQFRSFLSVLIVADIPLWRTVPAILAGPAALGVIFGWLISDSTEEKSTTLTLFIKGLVIDLLLFMLFFTVASLVIGVNVARDWVQ
jgi:hypothetical protein